MGLASAINNLSSPPVAKMPPFQVALSLLQKRDLYTCGHIKA